MLGQNVSCVTFNNFVWVLQISQIQKVFIVENEKKNHADDNVKVISRKILSQSKDYFCLLYYY